MIDAPNNSASHASSDQQLFDLGEVIEPCDLHHDLRAVLALWNKKRGDRRMPVRDDIKPRDMITYLSYLQLYEVLCGGSDFRIRLMGTDFTDTMGYNPTGQCVSELADPVLRERTSTAALRAVETCGPVRTLAAYGAKALNPYKAIEKIFLPLGVGDEVTHILCQAVRIGRMPLRQRLG